MTELKFTVNAEDPEALLKLAEICKSIALSITCGRPACNMDETTRVLTIPAQGHLVPVPPGAPLIVPGVTEQPGVTEAPAPVTEQPETPFSKLADLETLTDLKTDSKGRPWDIRIHSSSKKKLQKTGEWKLKRGADPALVTQLLNTPLTQIQEPAQTQTQEPAQTAGPIQDNLFTTLMTNLTKWLGEGTMNMKHVNDILARFNVPSVEYLQTCNDNDLISTVNFKLVEQWQLLNPNPA